MRRRTRPTARSPTAAPSDGAQPERPEAVGGAVPSTAVLLVSLTYLATTTGEALLAPVYPLAAGEIGLDLAGAGAAFAALALAISAFTIVGGLLLRVMPTKTVLVVALGTTSIGGVVAATASGPVTFLTAQALLGAGAGLLYPAAILSIGALAGPERRGFAMGVFGIFFSGGLALAAGLAAVGSEQAWRWTFGSAATLAAASAVAVALRLDAPSATTSGPVFAGLRAVLGGPTIVGIVGGVSQYATVSFLPIFAVTVWETSEAAAAGLLVVARLLSVPAKLVSGMAADHWGPLPTAMVIGIVLTASGVTWSIAPWLPLAVAAAVLFAAEASALFPLANLLAVERVGSRGPALGAFRSVQLGVAAAAGAIVGAGAHRFGLRPTLAVASLLPLALLIVAGMWRRPRP